MIQRAADIFASAFFTSLGIASAIFCFFVCATYTERMYDAFKARRAERKERLRARGAFTAFEKHMYQIAREIKEKQERERNE